ncbi:uncharacterized protein LOC129971304 [Argiope bruennichi]|uniref:uncharacterized protein LOC129971304 n=1 Tax=Argiope bruennichi TaxID=94029 RepID=UPI002494E218|nr:uncharacterized protein LOC129971304 [Argiope bruennichi]
MGACRGKETCGRCSEIGHDSKSCTSAPKCSNCKEDHPSYSRKCPRWIEEKEIQTIKVTQNIPFAEARKLVKSRTPTVGVSYSSMLSCCPHCKTKLVQKETPSNANPNPLPEKSPVKNNSESTNSKTKSIHGSPNPLNISKIEVVNVDNAVSQENIQSSPMNTVDNLAPNKASRIPTSNNKKVMTPKKPSKFFKETKAMRKARMQAFKNNLDEKIKGSVKKRTLTKQDLLKESKTEEEDDIKIHPSDDDFMSTDGEEQISKIIQKNKTTNGN